MGARQDYISQIKQIFQESEAKGYEGLKVEFNELYLSKRKIDLERFGDISVEDRLKNFDVESIDSDTKSIMLELIDKIKNPDYIFSLSDKANLGIFTKKIDKVLSQCQYITNIFDGENNYVKGHKMDIVILFNDAMEYDTLNEFLSNTKIDPAFKENNNFKSFLIYFFVIIKNIQDKNRYPLYYKYYQNIVAFLADIKKLDYDSFCAFYRKTNLNEEPKLLSFNLYLNLIAESVRNEIKAKGLSEKSVDKKWLRKELFNMDREISESEDSAIIEAEFKVWLTKELPASVKAYLSSVKTVNKISERIGLGNFYFWTSEDFSENKELLFSDPEFIDKNESGNKKNSNLINRFRDFLIEREEEDEESEPEDISTPARKYDDYRWYWSTLRPVLDLNRLDIIFGVTKVIGEIGGKVANSKAFKDKLKQLEKDLKIDDKRLSKHDTELNRNIIASVREYWQGPGILNTDSTLTNFGLSIANGTLSYDEFILELVNNFNLPNPNLPQRYSPEVIKNWEINNLRIAPFKIIIQILTELFYKFDFGTQSYLSVDELIDIVIPISADTPSDIKKYCNAIIKSRNGELDLSKWQKYMTFGQDEGRLPKEFLIVLKYWGLLEEVQLKGNEESARYYLTNKARSMFVPQNNNFGGEIPLPPSQNPCSSPLVNHENKIFYGAPGTGKSYKVSKILEKRLPKKQCRDKFAFRVTFHPEYDHASFVGGYKPYTPTGTADIKYEFVPQIFTNVFVKACNDPHNQYYLIIEEINRGNCAEIFGDLFQLLDRNDEYSINPSMELTNYLNKEGVITNMDTPYWVGDKMLLPNNISLLATMNTSDQSLMPMDSAFKRRWDWEYVPIIYTEKDPETGKDNTSFKYNVQFGDPKETFSWIKFIETINNKISKIDSLGMDKCLGNYFVQVEENAQNEYLISEETFINKVLFYLWNDVFKDENDEDGESIFKGMTFMSFFPKDDAKVNIKKILKELDEYRFDQNKLDKNKMSGKIYEKNEPSESIKEKVTKELDTESTETKPEE